MKAPDQVLPRHQIAARLAAHRRIHLREQRGRNLNHGNTAHVNRGQKSAEIGDDAAAKCDPGAQSVGAAFRHLFGELLDMRHALVLFTAGEKKYVRRVEFQFSACIAHAIAMQIPDAPLRNYEDASAIGRQKLGKARNRAALHYNGVIPLRCRDRKPGHFLNCVISLCVPVFRAHSMKVVQYSTTMWLFDRRPSAISTSRASG